MKNFDTRVYSVNDFVEWDSRNQLQLSPDFQRRSVWTQKGKSYLVDTILRGKPMPKILIAQEIKDKRSIRVVVDGQQRLRSILEYIEDAFPVSRAHNRQYAGKRYSQLPSELQSEILKYEIGVDLLYDLPYREILDIFARLNTYTVRLNKQELLNAKYVGFFKQLAYEMGYRYVDYWISAGIITKAQATRMAEAELSSDLIIALVEGVQTNKNIESIYSKYEEDFPEIDFYEKQFEQTMSIIGDIYGSDEISSTNWSRIQLFYTLFTVIAHGLFGLDGLEEEYRLNLKKPDISALRVRLDDISARYDRYTDRGFDPQNIPTSFGKFIDTSRRGTTDTGARIYRANFVARELISGS